MRLNVKFATRLTGDTFQVQNGHQSTFEALFEGNDYDGGHYYGIRNQSTLDPLVSGMVLVLSLIIVLVVASSTLYAKIR